MPEQSSEATNHLVSETQTPFPKTEFPAQEAVSSSVEFSSENPVGDSPEQESSSSDGAAPLDNEAFFSTSESVALEGTQSSETTLQTPVQETEDIASSSEVKEEVLLPVNQVSATAPIQEPAAPVNGNLLNLDEMISQFSGATTSSSDLDPFQAMKVTLEAQQDVPSEQTSAVATLPPSPISSTITALPEQQLVQEAVSLSPETMSTAQNLDPQQQLPSEKEGVSLGAITATNPLTAPATQPVLTGSGAQTKNFIKFAFAGLAVLAIGVIMVIRYPDLFSGTTPAPAPVGENTEEPHGAAPELPLTGDKQELSLQSSNEDLV